METARQLELGQQRKIVLCPSFGSFCLLWAFLVLRLKGSDAQGLTRWDPWPGDLYHRLAPAHTDLSHQQVRVNGHKLWWVFLQPQPDTGRGGNAKVADCSFLWEKEVLRASKTISLEKTHNTHIGNPQPELPPM